MPKIDCNRKVLDSLLNKKYTNSELEELFPFAKAELDGVDKDIIKVEFNDTNRPDLWSVYGLARQLRTVIGKKNNIYDFFSTEDNTLDHKHREIIVDSSVDKVRPYIVGFAVEGLKVDQKMLDALIQSQEKLCHNFGRKRKSIAMGIYRDDLINYPITYKAVDPNETRFTPLALDEELNLNEILEKHPKGQEFGHIIKDFKKYPFLVDKNNEVLSFPPIINSSKIGAVEVGDSSLFIELTGTVLDDLVLAASIMACDLSDMGWNILPVKVIYNDRNITIPYYFQKNMAVDLSYVHKILGLKLKKTEIKKALKRMGVFSVIDKKKVYITVPEYRNDFLHPIDIVEDIMIGYDLNNFETEMPSSFTMGRLSKSEELNRKVKDILIGLGFQEMMYNYLGSAKTFKEKMNVETDDYIQIANPMSENYEFVRPSILPSLLESESVSGMASYPHKIFECGKVAFKNKKENSGTSTYNYLGLSYSDSSVSYNDMASIISNLFYFMKVDYKLENREDSRFINGRCANIIVNNKVVGYFGEIHPIVLTNWNITTPVIASEVNLDFI